MTDLITPTIFIIALSVASERLTEIVKGIFFPTLLKEIVADEKLEALRKAKIQLLAVASGIAVAALSYPISSGYFEGFFKPMPEPLLYVLMTVSVGLLTSGGAGAWNSILGALLKLKA